MQSHKSAEVPICASSRGRRCSSCCEISTFDCFLFTTRSSEGPFSICTAEISQSFKCRTILKAITNPQQTDFSGKSCSLGDKRHKKNQQKKSLYGNLTTKATWLNVYIVCSVSAYGHIPLEPDKFASSFLLITLLSQTFTQSVLPVTRVRWIHMSSTMKSKIKWNCM